MRSEYDFSGGVRGKHHQAYRQGHQVKIHQNDGSIVVQNFKLEEGAVFLEPDVQLYFSTSEAVNNALRGLIALIPKKQRKQERRLKKRSKWLNQELSTSASNAAPNTPNGWGAAKNAMNGTRW